MTYDIKVYDGYEEKETIRGLEYSQMNAILRAFEREGVTAAAIDTESRTKYEVVNSTVHC
ncbi:hypothetical protein CP556_14110 [Natrinema sp. CBA1119]|uniref:hypothetical protein n=1 Tax=Natrinema sp. CBA1119 TaxID=1608465 RepID=UPI000BFAA949|nr:hypothetical protein [Natrinema sp. CBA1119]PGF17141.1 hypothetical protein CP556_14110 [Natrinema sp. CBA1119]